MENEHQYTNNEHQDSSTVPQSDASERLEPTSPQKAIELYIDARKNEVAAATTKSQQYRLGTFVEWCDHDGIENMNVLTGRSLYEFRIWKQENHDIAPYTLRTHMSTVRTFIRFCEQIEVVQGGLSDKILLPQVDPDERTRDTILDAEQATEIRDHLRKFNYASRKHVIIELLWHIGCRIGGLYALDVGDFHPQNQSLKLTHRPNRSTPLKNKSSGERPVVLSDDVTEIVADYIQYTRINVKDEHGRNPLFTSENGRLGKSAMRKDINRVTQPCLTGPCPHGRTQEDCKAYQKRNYVSECPSSVRPHDVRRGSITNLKQQNVPNEVVSDRMDVGSDVLDEHYDKRQPSERMELRREYLDTLDL